MRSPALKSKSPSAWASKSYRATTHSAAGLGLGLSGGGGGGPFLPTAAAAAEEGPEYGGGGGDPDPGGGGGAFLTNEPDDEGGGGGAFFVKLDPDGLRTALEVEEGARPIPRPPDPEEPS